jgi:hypothetical protein
MVACGQKSKGGDTGALLCRLEGLFGGQGAVAGGSYTKVAHIFSCFLIVIAKMMFRKMIS